MGEIWDGTVNDAKKVLGEEAEIPSLKNDPTKSDNEFLALGTTFEALRDNIENALRKLEDQLSFYKNAIKQNAAVYEGEDFGLDKKSKDDAKKIKQAQKIFSDYFADVQAGVVEETKALDELDKHVIQLAKYKPSLEV